MIMKCKVTFMETPYNDRLIEVILKQDFKRLKRSVSPQMVQVDRYEVRERTGAEDVGMIGRRVGYKYVITYDSKFDKYIHDWIAALRQSYEMMV